jgi:hypothetical protein
MLTNTICSGATLRDYYDCLLPCICIVHALSFDRVEYGSISVMNWGCENPDRTRLLGNQAGEILVGIYQARGVVRTSKYARYCNTKLIKYLHLYMQNQRNGNINMTGTSHNQ